MPGVGTIWEHGQLHTGNAADEDEDITGSSEVGEGASGSGSQSGATYWSYSGSGSYTDSNAASGVSFFLPNGLTPTISASVTGSAWASGSITGAISGSWSNSASGSASIIASGSGSIDLTFDNSASYSGSGSFTASGAMTGGGTIWEHGWQHTTDNPVSDETIAGSTELPTSGSAGGGSQSGSTFWSYSGSGSYTDANGTSGIAFLLPGSSSTPITVGVSGSVTGTAWASGYVNTTDQGSWTATQNASGVWSYSGSGTNTNNESKNASYSGGGSFWVSGSASGGGTITESGHQNSSASYTGNNTVNGSSGNWVLQSGSASGSESGSTSWSYSGSASYSDSSIVGSISAFPVPFSGTPVTSGDVTGTTRTSGSITTTSQDNWTANANAGTWSYSGSGTNTANESVSMSYSGSGSFTQTMSGSGGAWLNANGTLSESGYSNTSATYTKVVQMNGSGTWVEQSGTGSGEATWCTGWSYSGSGTYSYPSSSGTISGSTSATGGKTLDPGESKSDEQYVPSPVPPYQQPLTFLEWTMLPKLSKEDWDYIITHSKDNPTNLFGYIRDKLKEKDPTLQTLYDRWDADFRRNLEAEQARARAVPPTVKDPITKEPQPPKLLPKVSPEDLKQAQQEVEKTIAESKKRMQALQKKVDQAKKVMQAEEKWRELHDPRVARNNAKWFFQKYENESEEEARLKSMQLLYDPHFRLNPDTKQVEGADAEGRAILKQLARWRQIHNMQVSEKFKEVFEKLKKMTDENGKPLLSAEMEKVLADMVKPENLALMGAGVGVGVGLSAAGGPVTIGIASGIGWVMTGKTALDITKHWIKFVELTLHAVTDENLEEAAREFVKALKETATEGGNVAIGAMMGGALGRLRRLRGAKGAPKNRFSPLERDATGKVHGDIPKEVPKNWTREQMKESAAELERSIARRKQEAIEKGRPLGGEDEPGHRARIGEEETFLRKLLKKLSGS